MVNIGPSYSPLTVQWQGNGDGGTFPQPQVVSQAPHKPAVNVRSAPTYGVCMGSVWLWVWVRAGVGQGEVCGGSMTEHIPWQLH